MILTLRIVKGILSARRDRDFVVVKLILARLVIIFRPRRTEIFDRLGVFVRVVFANSDESGRQDVALGGGSIDAFAVLVDFSVKRLISGSNAHAVLVHCFANRFRLTASQLSAKRRDRDDLKAQNPVVIFLKRMVSVSSSDTLWGVV